MEACQNAISVNIYCAALHVRLMAPYTDMSAGKMRNDFCVVA